MTTRNIKNAQGNLYDPKSEACQNSLMCLSDLLKDLGFKSSHHSGEDTNRVYPVKYRQYPLLNPRYEYLSDSSEVLVISIMTHIDYDTTEIEQKLQKHVNTAECTFIPERKTSDPYWVFGRFIIPLVFVDNDIDFDFLANQLTIVYQLLL